MKINLTDQELNEWVAELCGININCTPEKHMVFEYKSAKTAGKQFEGQFLYGISFDPCQDLNHTNLMEEKIRDTCNMDEIEKIEKMNKMEKYYETLYMLVDGISNSTSIDMMRKRMCVKRFNVLHASARQRVEAAYITFKD